MSDPAASDAASTRRDERPIVRVLVVVGAVLLALTLAVVYVRDAVLDSDEFADRVVVAVRAPEVQRAITAEVTEQIVALDADLLLIRPVVEAVVEAVVQSRTFEDVVRFAAVDLHQAVVDASSDTVTVELAEVVLMAKVSLTKIDAEAAAAIPDDLTDGLISIQTHPLLVDIPQLADDLRLLAFVLPVLVVACFAAALWLARDRRAVTAKIGVAAIAAGAAVAIVVVVLGVLVVERASSASSHAVTAALWDSFFADAITWSMVTVAVGGAVAGSAALSGRRLGARDARATVSGLVRPPSTRAGGVIWALAVGVLGVLVIVEWQVVARMAVTLVGAALIVVAVGELRSALARPSRPTAPAPTDAGRTRRFPWSAIAAVAAAVAGLGVLLLLIGRSGGEERIAAAGDPACNGSVLLCDRPVDRVAFATTHNSMAAANDGFTIGYQTVGIIPQLDDGYRGLLIDAYFGLESDDLVVTDRAPLDDDERAALVADVGEGVVSSAEALRASRLAAGDIRDVFLCHSFCEVGAVRMADEMARIRRWLEANPREVLLVIVQDEGPRDVDIERVFRESGLIDFVHTQRLEDSWPTLRELIDSGRRIWVSAENDAGDLDWYHDAFTFVQDTPHSAPSLDELSCEPFRGDPSSPLFLVNHWLSPVSPTQSDSANARGVLEARLADCETARNLFPNMIAVDFSDRGDTLAVVDDLNGVRAVE